MEHNNELDEMDGYMEFFYQFSPKDPAISMRISPQSDLSEVFEAFEKFLRGCGYHIEGEIDLIRDDVPQDSEAELN